MEQRLVLLPLERSVVGSKLRRVPFGFSAKYKSCVMRIAQTTLHMQKQNVLEFSAIVPNFHFFRCFFFNLQIICTQQRKHCVALLRGFLSVYLTFSVFSTTIWCTNARFCR
jgi:hypothetical protein